MRPKPGEVWLADLGLAAKTRLVIVSRFDPDPPRILIISIPFATANRNSRYEVDAGKLSFLLQASVLNVQGIASLPVARLERRLGQLPGSVFDQVKNAIRCALEI